MPIIIRVTGINATIDDGKWTSDDLGLLELLQMKTTEPLLHYTPWPDYTLAQMAADALGGKIIEATDPPEYVVGRVY